MLGKLKRVLGIEGVKLDLYIKLPIDKKEKEIVGNLKFTTKTESVVKGITVKIVEKYSRGRGKDRLVDEYTIAQLELTDSFVISPEEIVEVPFSIMYEIALSEMDKMAKNNIVQRPFISFAKFLRKVKSEFTLVAEADVDGTTLNPFVKEAVEL
ncbi:MAG: hypothetical protein ACI9P5_003472 [Saprospiraceae bacterium]|jgi:hypothetical protein|tara:strand:+ start:742 stop:1203 length:462 start_codon:yes stop_codon:yes gene_type:complete